MWAKFKKCHQDLKKSHNSSIQEYTKVNLESSNSNSTEREPHCILVVLRWKDSTSTWLSSPSFSKLSMLLTHFRQEPRHLPTRNEFPFEQPPWWPDERLILETLSMVIGILLVQTTRMPTTKTSHRCSVRCGWCKKVRRIVLRSYVFGNIRRIGRNHRVSQSVVRHECPSEVRYSDGKQDVSAVSRTHNTEKKKRKKKQTRGETQQE